MSQFLPLSRLRERGGKRALGKERNNTMSADNFSKTRHDLNNKIATLDASLSAFRIYLQRLADAAEDAVLYQKTLTQLQEISADILKVSTQMDVLTQSLDGAEERT